MTFHSAAGRVWPGSVLVALCVALASPAVEAQVFQNFPAVRYGADEKPEDPVVADFDGDGHSDVAVANTFFGLSPAGGSVSVFFGEGDGSFLDQVLIDTGFRTEGITAGDFDGDGLLDLATANFTDSNLTILINDGLRGFTASNRSQADAPRHLTAADFDGGGTMDIITANYDAGTVTVLAGNGNGTFTELQTFVPTSGADGCETVSVAFLDNDLVLDVLVTNALSDDVVALFGVGDGTFVPGPKLDLPVGARPRYSTIADLNADGFDDFITSNFNDGNLIIARNNGGSSFVHELTLDLPAGANDRPIFANFGDLNNDGTLDALVSVFGNDQIRMFEGFGGFSFATTSEPLSTQDRPYGTVVLDLNGDSLNDLVVVETGTNTVAVYLGDDGFTNLPPNAFDDVRTVLEESGSNVLTVLANDVDPNSADVLDITSVGTPDMGGTAVSNGDSITYIPPSGFTGIEMFSYTIADGNGGSDSATVTVTVVAADSVFQQDTGPECFLVMEAENYHELQPSSTGGAADWVFTSNTPSGHSGAGAMVIDPAGTGPWKVNFGEEAPGLDFRFEATSTGTHYVHLRAYAPSTSSNSAHVGLNGQEVASADNYSFDVTGGYVWNNSTRTINIPTLGVHTLNVWGRESNTTLDRVIVTCDSGYDPSGFGPPESPRGGGTPSPSAADDSFSVEEDSSNNTLSVLVNDSDSGGGSNIEIDTVGSPDMGGSVSIVNGATELEYTPAASFSGVETFSYTLIEAGVGTATAQVTVTVNAGNESPTAFDDSYTVVEDSSANVLSVLTNDTDPNVGDTLLIDSVGAPDMGGTVLIVNGATELEYTPAGGFTGTESFTYTISDDSGAPDSATVTVTVIAPGVGFQQSSGPECFLVMEAENFDTSFPAVTSGPADWVSTTIPAGFSGSGAMVILPAGTGPWKSGWVGTAPELVFNFEAVATGTHYVWVRGHRDSGSSDSVHIGLDGQESEGGQSNPSFSAGAGYVWISSPKTMTIPTTGSHTFHLWGREAGTEVDRIVITCDASYTPTGAGPAESPRGDGGPSPTATSDVFSVEEDSSNNTLNVLLNDSDSGGGSSVLIDSVESPDMGGTVSIVNGATELEYTPAASFSGVETFSYTILEAGVGTATAQVTVTVNPDTTQPTAVDDMFNVLEDSADNLLNVLLNDSDSSGGSNIQVTSIGPLLAGGTASITGGGTQIAYTPAAGFFGIETFDYTITETGAGTSTATVTLTVDPVGGGGGAFLQDSGAQCLLSVEVENFDLAEDEVGGGATWAMVALPLGFSGSGAMVATPASGGPWKDNFAGVAPHLSYTFEATATGVHYVWVRVHSPSSSRNSCHVGFDGQEVSTADDFNFDVSSGYIWSTNTRTLTIPTLGTHTLDVWAREAGTVIDKVVVTCDPDYEPSGSGPPESPRS